MWYASKYMAKKADNREQPAVGRLWGIHNRKQLPILVITFAIQLTEFWRLKRTLRRAGRVNRRPPLSNVWCRGGTIYASSSITAQYLAVLRN
jgi:hypothetical protein